MAFYSAEQLYAAARDLRQRANKTNDQLLREARETAKDMFDVFLSHSSRDKDLVLGAKKVIEDAGYTVYVDWIDDAQVNVVADRALADRLRRRMGQCSSLFYLHTPNAALSKWCPWELGYFDGLRSPEAAVFVFPVLTQGQLYKGQEYLDLYDTVDLPTWRPPRRSPRSQRPGAIDERLFDGVPGMLWRPGGGIF